jgi:hypothetical protein
MRPFAILILALCLLTAGCDPTRTTSQTIRLRVLDSASGKPLAGARVWMKWDYRDYERSEPQRRDQIRENWRQFPWSSSPTDSAGGANIHIKYTAIDGTRGPMPPPSRDWITDKPYVVRVRHGNVPDEILSLVVTPGQSVQGKSFTVVIDSIDNPFYCDTSK